MISSEILHRGCPNHNTLIVKNFFHNKPSYNFNYNSKDPYKIKNLSKDLTPKEFKSFSKYEKKRLMNDELINAKVHNWLMTEKITDSDVN